MGITSMLAKAAYGQSSASNLDKATLVIEKGGVINVQFNPAQFTITERASYSLQERRKEDEPLINYNGTQLSTLNVQLIFNSAEFTSIQSIASAVKKLFGGGEDNDITKTIDRISKLTRIDGDQHRPSGVTFVWGVLSFAGFVESVGTTYTMFDKSGKPLSATVNLTIRGFNGNAGERYDPFQSPDRTKRRIMTEDASIWEMADKEYGDVREWRRIAEANDVMNPLDIPVGKALRVPSIND